MRIGFLHLGAPHHGVTRFGRALASTMAAGVGEVLEVSVTEPDRRSLADAADRLVAADVVHIQLNARAVGSLWGGISAQRRNLGVFLSAIGVPVVATVHDLRTPGTVPPLPDPRRLRSVRGLVRGLARAAVLALPLENRLLRDLAGASAALVVCSEEEAARLLARTGIAAAAVVPHFVEERPVPQPTEVERWQRLGRIVTLLGFIHERKGHDLALEALASFPDDVLLVFAGAPSPGWAWYAESLERRARARGLDRRLRITGYLPDPELDALLAASELAICPFRDVSASGSLSTLIAAGVPVVASDLPLLREYRRRAPAAFELVQPGDTAALARAVTRALDDGAGRAARAELAALAQDLSPDRTAERYLEIYRSLAG